MATIYGTTGADKRIGTSGNDTMFGWASGGNASSPSGNDTLDGGAGNDRILGGTANDNLYGGLGLDTLRGGLGNDNLHGDDGNDKLFGEAGNDTLGGGRGNDTVDGGAGNDLLTGGTDGNPENDITYGNTGNDIIFGGDGNDILSAQNYLGYDSNYQKTYQGEDILYGDDGNDVLYGGAAKNTLSGGSGNDTYIVFTTTNTIIEAVNSGIDTVQSSVSYTLGSGLENLTLIGVGATGTGNSLNNTLIADAGNNFLSGEAGNDNLNGGAGNDTLLGGSGAVGERDTLSGGVGRDTFILGNATGVFYDDRNKATAGRSDYALITDFSTSDDVIRLNGSRADYRLAHSPTGSLSDTAIYLNNPGSEPDELIAIIQGSSGLSLSGNYFRFTADKINLSALNGSNGFVINGIDAGDLSGLAVSSAGDVNGDGFDDLLIGARGADPNGQDRAGESYVVFGKDGGFDASLNLSTLNGSNGFVINGIDAGDLSGLAVSGAGDVNGDGFDDLLIGAPSAAPNGQYSAGESYVVFGKDGGFDASLNLSALNGSNGFVINGIDQYDRSGSVSSAGDVNGDGFDDLIVGAPFASPNGQLYAGSSYVVFGKAEGFDASLNLSSLNGSNGFVINGINSDEYTISGASVSGAGDVNSDGFDDLLIGASSSESDGFPMASESYVVFGKPGEFDASLNASMLNGSNGFVLNGIDDRSNTRVSSAGDVNGDGFDDLLIGVPFAASNGQYSAGESYIVFGKDGGFDASLNLSTLNGSNGFVINGINEDDNSGSSVSSAGDVNGDGFDDLLLGASGADPNGSNEAGESYVVFGKAGGFGASLDLLDINGSNGFVINGIDELDRSGAVSSAGDVNGDGFDDLMVGASAADPNGQDAAGESYVIFGRDFTNSVTRAGTAGNDTLTGTAANDVLVGGLGNDRLIGGGGVDVLYGGAGNDILSYGTTARRLDGGSGRDTLRIDTNGANIALSNRLREFELVDITGTGNNSLTFTRLDVLNLSDTTNQLIVNGNTGDRVTSTGQGWAFAGTTTQDSILYRQYNSGSATLLVDADITQAIS